MEGHGFMKLRLASILVMVCSVPLFACGGDSGDGDGDFEIDPAGTDTGFVAATISVPETSGQAGTFALDIDGNGSEENSLGQSLGLLGGMGIDLQGSVTDSVNAGSVIVLANLKATAFDNATGVGMTFYLGENPGTTPCTDEADPLTCGQHLTGGSTFDVSAGSPPDALVGGQILGGAFETKKAGSVTLELELVEGQPKIVVNLIGARTKFSVDASGTTITNGILGGAISSDDVETNILPLVVDLVQETVMEDCTLGPPDCCVDGSTGETLLNLFDPQDEGADCMVTDQQVRDNNIVASIVAPDLDLFDANGDFNPNDDEVNDAISLGLGFTGVTATFTP